jgi:hypothetical protein
MMTFNTWEAMAKRQVWYRDVVLAAKLKEWPTERIDSYTDSGALQRVIELTERVERHQLRMDRHIRRALAAIDGPSKQKH